jgi:hypothetical protein
MKTQSQIRNRIIYLDKILRQLGELQTDPSFGFPDKDNSHLVHVRKAISSQVMTLLEYVLGAGYNPDRNDDYSWDAAVEHFVNSERFATDDYDESKVEKVLVRDNYRQYRYIDPCKCECHSDKKTRAKVKKKTKVKKKK